MNYQKIFLLLAIASLLSSCSRLVTRTETDKYIITIRDTTNREDVHNMPGTSDNGIIFPTSIEQHSHREVVQYDSSYSRYYPAFLRYGIIEAASFITPGNLYYGTGAGLFGIFGLFDSSFGGTNHGSVFAGGMYRFFPWEDQLKIKGLNNLTLGLAGFEMIAKDARVGDALFSVSPIYLRKRFFLRDDIPYIMVVPFAGISFFPSIYLNIGATLDVGSIGGMNARVYAGYVTGSNPSYLFQGGSGIFDSAAAGHLGFPYIGIGISVLDFVNRVEETQQEWRFHKHSSTEVTVLQLTPIISTHSGAKLFSELTVGNTKIAGGSFLNNFDGIALRFATVSYPLGENIDRGFNVGTSLFNILLLSNSGGGFGVLPLRAGYRAYIDPGKYVSVEPFAEINYYPSTFVNAGGRLNVGPFSGININLWGGFAAGSHTANGWTGLPTNSFSNFYAGLGIATGQYLFSGNPLKTNE